jgi:TRAP-type transport system periplasmic protein
MDKVFEHLGKINRQDNINATEALKTQGIKVITPSPQEVKRWKMLSKKSIQKIMDNKEIDKNLVMDMNRLLDEIR